MADPHDLPDPAHTVDVRLAIAIERLSEATRRSSEAMEALAADMREHRRAVEPCVTAYQATLAARLAADAAEAGALTNLRAKVWTALANPVVVLALVSALLAGLGFGGAGERVAAAVTAALAPPGVTIEVSE